MGGRSRAVRRPGWVAAELVAVVALTLWLVRAKSGVNIAAILTLTVAIVTLLATTWKRLPSGASSEVARKLANGVAEERGRARGQALGVAGDARPADAIFRGPVPGMEPELVRWRSDGGSEHGTLRNVAGYYRSLDRGRMVVLGEAGAGKTVLATQLVIDLIDELPEGELQPGKRPPVPVWFTLASVDLGEAESLARVSGKELADRLDRQMAAQISAAYQIPRSTAEELIRDHWVLPVLDGLDEMDAPGPEGSGPVRSRAAAVVRALNDGTGKRPVVLVCRREAYGQLAQSPSVGREDPVLQDARQIVLQFLDARAICDYLTWRFPGERPGDLAPRWHKVQDTLLASEMPGHDDGLAAALSSPWRLFLAATAYQDENSNPDELIQQTADDVGEYLLSQLIPALTSQTARPDGGHYQPGEVRTWLGTLARHLEQSSNDPNLRWSPTDLRLEQLWPIGGRKTVRRLSTLASAILLGALLAVPGLVWVHAHGRWYPDTRTSWIGLIGSIAGIAFAANRFAVAPALTLSRLDLRLVFRVGRRKLAAWLAAWLAFGLAVGLTGGLAFGVAFGLAGGLTGGLGGGVAGGLAFGPAFGMAGDFSLATQPTTVMLQNLYFAVLAGLAFGPAFGLAAALAAWLAVGLGIGLAGGLAFGRAFGLAAGMGAGMAVGMALGLAIWIRYLIGCWLARRKGLLPRRVGRFFNWACRAGLLRMSGTAAQFRHRELQAWLMSQAKDRDTQIAQE